MNQTITIATVEVVPVVSDAAVEAAAQALADDWNPDRDPVLTAMFRDYAATAVAAALPFLGAAPSATREDVAESISSTHVTGREGAATAADALLARFTITPRTDR